MKFQDSSLNGLKVRVGTKKCDTRTHGCSKSNMPHQLFQSWGHNKSDELMHLFVYDYSPQNIIMQLSN